MGRPRMNRILPKYASEFADRHGKKRVRLRRTGWPTIYPQAAPGTPEFTAEYLAWMASGKREVGADKPAPGSLDELIARFYQSKAFMKDIKPQTQRIYRGELERFRAKYGSRSASTMTARHISNLIGGMAGTPSAANNLRKRLAQLFKFAVNIGVRPDNPAAHVNGFKIKTGGYLTWQEEQITAFEAKHPIGTPQRLAFDLALYTAQRRSDVRRMGPQHVEGDHIRVLQVKTGKPLTLPIHPNLRKSIDATPTGHLAFIVTERGVPRTINGFGNWFRTACDDAGLQGYSMHGLRKAAARRFAELGLSNQLIKSFTGHTSDSEVARYTRDAEQARMADLVMDLATRPKADLANLPQASDNT